MNPSRRVALGVLGLTLAAAAAAAQMTAPNPYRAVEGTWGKLPAGRTWGATSGVWTATDGTIWVAERCGANTCIGSSLDPILAFDRSGQLKRSFGAGLIAWPHGLYVDHQGNVWVTDALGFGQQPAGLGHIIVKFSPTGQVLMTLGKKGVAGRGRDTFRKPSAIVATPDGSHLFVADGHDEDGNNRIVKLTAQGQFLKEWGSTGGDAGQFRDPHALAMDSQGRLFVADRANSRIQIFDQEGKHLATWTQFGRPSGIYIDKNDLLYASDSESNAERNPGWKRGIYIGSAKTGWVTAFIPDPEPDQDNSATSGAEGIAADGHGDVYAAEVGPKMLRKYLRRNP
ncbi:MAG: peptidyl-alpha-hydroxyglycine alpha-amidating lyase family protein [Gemmatimonadales bacterium]